MQKTSKTTRSVFWMKKGADRIFLLILKQVASKERPVRMRSFSVCKLRKTPESLNSNALRRNTESRM